MSFWSVLFLKAVSPGQVFRFFERRQRSGERIPDSLLLSEPTPPEGWRALLLPGESAQAQRVWATLLSTAFSPSVVWLCASPTEWQVAHAMGGTLTDEKHEIIQPPSLLVQMLERLPGARSAPSPPILWARQHGYPVHRVPEVLARTRQGGGNLPIVEYKTVTALDQRGLLMENEPKLYRFTSTVV